MVRCDWAHRRQICHGIYFGKSIAYLGNIESRQSRFVSGPTSMRHRLSLTIFWCWDWPRRVKKIALERMPPMFCGTRRSLELSGWPAERYTISYTSSPTLSVSLVGGSKMECYQRARDRTRIDEGAARRKNFIKQGVWRVPQIENSSSAVSERNRKEPITTWNGTRPCGDRDCGPVVVSDRRRALIVAAGW